MELHIKLFSTWNPNKTEMIVRCLYCFVCFDSLLCVGCVSVVCYFLLLIIVICSSYRKHKESLVLPQSARLRKWVHTLCASITKILSLAFELFFVIHTLVTFFALQLLWSLHRVHHVSNKLSSICSKLVRRRSIKYHTKPQPSPFVPCDDVSSITLILSLHYSSLLTDTSDRRHEETIFWQQRIQWKSSDSPRVTESSLYCYY